MPAKQPTKKTRHQMLMQPEIDEYRPTILCGNAQPGDTHTRLINSKYSPVTCKACLLKMAQVDRHFHYLDENALVPCGAKMTNDNFTTTHKPRVTCEECRKSFKAPRSSKTTKVTLGVTEQPVETSELIHSTYNLNEPLQSMGADWDAIWTAKGAEEELKGFKFKGLGWYITKDNSGHFDTMLVLPYGRLDTEHPTKLTEGNTEPDGTKLYKFLVYNGRNPAETFNWIVNAPTRHDERI